MNYRRNMLISAVVGWMIGVGVLWLAISPAWAIGSAPFIAAILAWEWHDLTRDREADHPTREGWVVLLDSQGREVSERRPVVVNCDPLEFSVSHDIDFKHITRGSASWVRVIDADGTARDVPIA